MRIEDESLYEKCCLDATKFKLLETLDEKRIYARAMYSAIMWGRKQDELLAQERERNKEMFVY